MKTRFICSLVCLILLLPGMNGHAQDHTLNLTLFLEGLWNGTSMNEAMDESGAHWGVGIADQITVELHAAFDPFGLVWSASNVFLAVDGNAAATVPSIHNGYYYIVIKHRNSIETWSKLPVSFAGLSVNYDFTTSQDKAYGNSLLSLGAGVYGIPAGDENQDDIIDSNDLGDTDNDAQNFVQGYVATDVNGDGIVDSNDLGIIDNNSTAFISSIPPFICGEPIMDVRDGKTYHTVQIGTQCWMRENLNIGTMINGSGDQTNNSVLEKYCYNNLESDCDVYGGLYQWAEMVQYLNGATNTTSWDPVPSGHVTGICPAGWHLPSDAEWTTLTTYLGGAGVAGGKIKEAGYAHWLSPNAGATNESGFTALPGGYRHNNGTFYSLGSYAYFWTSSENSSTKAWNRYPYYSTDDVYRGNYDKTYGISVRCIKGSNVPPAPPSSGIHIPSPDQVIWNWLLVPGATGYKWNTTNDFGAAVDLGIMTTKTETGLACNALYTRYVWAYNIYGNSTPATLTQTTSSCLSPVVSTAAITNISGTSATTGGDVTSDGGTSVTARGVCWNTSSNPTLANSHTIDGTGTGVYISNIPGLTENTLYYVRAYATNSIGTSYGNEVTFFSSSTGGQPCPGTPTVSYGSKTYNTVQIGTQCWFRENLNIGTKIFGSDDQIDNGMIEKYCYLNVDINCEEYGGLYQWAEMVQYLNGATNTTSWNPVPSGHVPGICPSGWHLPTHAEWTILTTFLGGTEIAGGKMKETGFTHWTPPNSGATNESGFSALAGGYRWDGGEHFSGISDNVTFWSSSEFPLVAWTRYMYYNFTEAFSYSYSKHYGFSVRCIKD